MHTLTKKEFLLNIEPILHQIFVGNDEDTEPFLPQIEDRLLLYFPLGGDIKKNNYTENRLFEAIAEAAKFVSDTGCYFVVGWGWLKCGAEGNRSAYIPRSELKEAFVPSSITGRDKIIWNQLDIEDCFVDFCLCSTNGDWGLLKTIDDYAFLGGNAEFMQAVKSCFPDVEKEVLEFLHDFKLAQKSGEQIDLNWLNQILTHVYGQEKADKLLKETGLS